MCAMKSIGTRAGADIPVPSPHKLAFDSITEGGAKWLDWIGGSQRFEGILKARVPWDQLNDGEKRFVGEKLKELPPNIQLVLNSLYVTMVAGFEEFLRSSIKFLVASVTGRACKYDDIKESIILMNIRESARLLRRMDSPPEYLLFSTPELCRGIGSCVPGSQQVELNSSAIADVDGLIRLDSFFDRVGYFGKDLSWDVLGKNPNLREALGIKSGGAREAGKQLSLELQAISRNRNRIAHTGGEASDVTSHLLGEHRNLLSSLSLAVDQALVEV